MKTNVEMPQCISAQLGTGKHNYAIQKVCYESRLNVEYKYDGHSET